jgi:hypothetical protein
MAPIRFSLKWLMASVALAALSVAAAVNASGIWATAIITVILICLLVAALVAAVGTGPGRACAIAFMIATPFYLFWWQLSMYPGTILTPYDLVTDRIVDRLYDLIKRESLMPAQNSGFMFGVGGGNKGGGAGFGMVRMMTPDRNEFQRIVHWQIAFYIGLMSGLFAARLRRVRSGA